MANLNLITLFGCLLLLETAWSLQCFQCESTEHSDCKEEFDYSALQLVDPTVRLQECKVDASSYCIKTTGVWGGVVGTTRFCSSRDMGNQCQYIRYPDHDRVYRACIYTCGRDGCNGARGLAAPLSLLLAALAAALLAWAR